MVSFRRKVIDLFFSQVGPRADKPKPRHVVRQEMVGRLRARERARTKRARSRSRRIIRRREAVGLD